jgi:acetyl/propionyl-CoA carboxylase alpha subunit
MNKEVVLNGHGEHFENIKSSQKEISFRYQGSQYVFELVHLGKNEMVLRQDGDLHRIFFKAGMDLTHISLEGRDAFVEKPALKKISRGRYPEKDLVSPMPGKILKIFVDKNDQVKKGQVLLIMEAMKMEHSIVAQRDGRITQIFFREGDYVEGERKLLEMDHA